MSIVQSWIKTCSHDSLDMEAWDIVKALGVRAPRSLDTLRYAAELLREGKSIAEAIYISGV